MSDALLGMDQQYALPLEVVAPPEGYEPPPKPRVFQVEGEGVKEKLTPKQRREEAFGEQGLILFFTFMSLFGFGFCCCANSQCSCTLLVCVSCWYLL